MHNVHAIIARSLARPSDVLPQARHATAAARPSVRPMGRPEKKSTAFSTTAAAAKKTKQWWLYGTAAWQGKQGSLKSLSSVLAARVFGAKDKSGNVLARCCLMFESKGDERHSVMPTFMNNLKSHSIPESRSINTLVVRSTLKFSLK